MGHVFQYKQIGTFEETESDASPEALVIYDQYVSDGRITNFYKRC